MKLSCAELARRSEGSVAVTSAMLISVVLAVAALGVDLGKVFTDRRKAQSTVDLAAIAAVSDLQKAQSAVDATLARNNTDKDATYALQYGIYSADPAVPPASRFVPSSSSAANAARVTLETSSAFFLAKPLTGKSKLAIRTTAIATRSSFASFAIGSRLVKVDGGLLNGILGGLLNSSLSLTAMDYQSLISANIDLLDGTKSLASRLQITTGTYNSVLNTNAKLTDVFAATLDTAKAKYGAANSAVQALSAINQSLQGSTAKIPVRSVIDLGPYGSTPIGDKPKAAVSASLYDMVAAAAQVANGQHQIEADLGVNLPGIAGASLKMAVGERPQGASWITVGSEGAKVYTAQTRLILTVKVQAAAPLATISLPIYVDIASGAARLSSLQCGFPNIGTSQVALDVTPGVIDAWIGDVSAAQMTNFKIAPNPPAATLISSPLLSVTGRAHATMSNMSATRANFYYADIQQQTKKTVGTTDLSSSLLSGLLKDTSFSVNVAGLGLGLGGSAVTALLATTLSGATSSIDQLLAGVLRAAGVGIGQADVWVTGIRCDGAVLVN